MLKNRKNCMGRRIMEKTTNVSYVDKEEFEVKFGIDSTIILNILISKKIWVKQDNGEIRI